MSFFKRKPKLLPSPPKVLPHYTIERINTRLPAVRSSQVSPPPPVLQRYAVERVNDLPTVREPILPVFGGGEGYGSVLPRIDTTPDVVEMFALPFLCSHTRQPFVNLFGRWQLGQPYQVMYNVSPQEANALARTMRQRGVHITQGKPGYVPVEDILRVNWQCLYCGHGTISGAQWNFVYCPGCDHFLCGAASFTPRNAAETFYCFVCNKTAVIGEKLQGVSVTPRLLRRQ